MDEASYRYLQQHHSTHHLEDGLEVNFELEHRPDPQQKSQIEDETAN